MVLLLSYKWPRALDDLKEKDNLEQVISFYLERMGRRPVFFGWEIAERIVSFVLKFKDKSIILIHCDAGISRSAAVAKALSLWYHKDGSRFDNLYLPNPMIFKIMNQTIERMDKNEESKH